MSDPRMRVELSIRGRVQGVWYRASARAAAEARHLVGWVRNCDDGSVQAVAEGPRSALEDFITWCHKGPPAARVDRVEASWSDPLGGFETFEVRR